MTEKRISAVAFILTARPTLTNCWCVCVCVCVCVVSSVGFPLTVLGGIFGKNWATSSTHRAERRIFPEKSLPSPGEWQRTAAQSCSLGTYSNNRSSEPNPNPPHPLLTDTYSTTSRSSEANPNPNPTGNQIKQALGGGNLGHVTSHPPNPFSLKITLIPTRPIPLFL